MASEAQKRAIEKYKTTVKEMRLTVKPEQKELFESYAKKAGISWNQYAIEAVEARIKRDSKKPQYTDGIGDW